MKTIPGVNVQWPISTLIVAGEKTVETRTYPLPQKYVGKELAMIETPGTSGKFKSRIVAIVRFEQSFQYRTKTEFIRDYKRHRVSEHSKWKWNSTKPKWGWPVKVLKILENSVPAPSKRGIIFAKSCKIT
jgi:hypothetical protein